MVSDVGLAKACTAARRRAGPWWKAALLAAPALAVLMWFEESFIYFPSRGGGETPGGRGIGYRDVALTTADGVRLHAWHVPGQGPLTLLWLHGNAGHIGHRVEQLALIQRRLGVGVFMLDYRGYGRSEGTPSEQGTYYDADAALAYLRATPEVDPAGVVLYGQSLGAAVAVELATRERVRALILEAPFASVPAMARAVYPWLPIWPLLRTRYDSLARIGGVRAPLLILHGERDEVVPYDQGRALYAAAAEPKRFHRIVGAGHNDAYYRGGEGYWGALAAFLAELEQPEVPCPYR
jgi:fermentation-respiration switch protein FrsA (DUF1100 family)